METHDLDVEISPYKNDHPVGNAIKSFIIMYIIESNENDEINSEIDNICNVINFCHTYVNNVYVNKIFSLLRKVRRSFQRLTCNKIILQK
jgi:hypothetical protein